MKLQFKYTNTPKAFRYESIHIEMPKRDLIYKINFKQKFLKYHFISVSSNGRGVYRFNYNNRIHIIYRFVYSPVNNKTRYKFNYKDISERKNITYHFIYTHSNERGRYKFNYNDVSGRIHITYRFVYAYSKAKGRYRFSYRNIERKYRGKYRFSYDCFGQIYYENPYTSLMLPRKIGQMENLFISLMLPQKISQLDESPKILILSSHESFVDQSLNLESNFKSTDIAKNYMCSNLDLDTIINNCDTQYELSDRLLCRDFNNINLKLKDFKGLDLHIQISLEHKKRNLYKSVDSFLTETILNEIITKRDRVYQYADLELEISKIFNLSIENKHIQYEITKEFDKSKIGIIGDNDKSLEYTSKSGYISSDKLTDITLKSLCIIEDRLIDLNSKTIYSIDDKLFKSDVKSGYTVGDKLIELKTKSILTDTDRILDTIGKIIEFSKTDILTEDIEQRNTLNEVIEIVLWRCNIRNYYYELLIHSFMKLYKLSQNDYFFERFMRETKDIDALNIESYLKKEAKDVLNYNYLKASDKSSKDINNLINTVRADKELKPTMKANLLKLLICIPKDIKFEDINDVLDLDTVREISSKSITKFAERDIHKNGVVNKSELHTDKLVFKNIADFIIENTLDSKVSKEVLFDSIAHYLEDYGYKDSSIENLPKPQNVLKDKEISIEKNILSQKKTMGLELFKTILLAYEAKAIDLNNEHELKLWQRFWFLYAGNIFDNKILPCCDFPYEEQPIEFEGFEDLMTENWQVTYPDTFWKNIDHHPVPEGSILATEEIPLAINIMVEIINILILMWYRYYSAFWGWTGTQAVLGITSSVFEWISLESSRAEQNNKNSKQHYDRCYRWLRWEAEKMALLARNDMELKGNYYVGLLLEEMINYMLDHHFDIMPIFIDVNKMDEWRTMFNTDLQNDITWVLDKVKSIRHKLIVGKEKKENV